MPWGVANYNLDPTLNTSINGIDIAEGSNAAGYNDALRQIMADVAGWVSTGLATLGGLPVSFRDLVPITKGASFTLADSERGCALNYTGAAAALTINPEASTAITYGAVYVIRNGGTGNLTVTPGAGVILNANGAVASGPAVIGQGGVATLIKWGGDFFTLTGSNIS